MITVRIALTALGFCAFTQAPAQTPVVLIRAEAERNPKIPDGLEGVALVRATWAAVVSVEFCTDIQKRIAALHAEDKEHRVLAKLLTDSGFLVEESGRSPAATITHDNECNGRGTPYAPFDAKAELVTRWQVSVVGIRPVKDFSVSGEAVLGLNEPERKRQARLAGDEYVKREKQMLAEIVEHLRNSLLPQSRSVTKAPWRALCKPPLDPGEDRLDLIFQLGVPGVLRAFATALAFDMATAIREASVTSKEGHFADAVVQNEKVIISLAEKSSSKGDKITPEEVKTLRIVRLALYVDAANALRQACQGSRPGHKFADACKKHEEHILQLRKKGVPRDDVRLSPFEEVAVCAILKAYGE